MSRVTADRIAQVARAFDVDPRDVRADTPLQMLGWTGSATDWLLVADHLGLRLTSDPPDAVEPATIADVVAIVLSAGEGCEHGDERSK